LISCSSSLVRSDEDDPNLAFRWEGKGYVFFYQGEMKRNSDRRFV